jgi:hypothetical protein
MTFNTEMAAHVTQGDLFYWPISSVEAGFCMFQTPNKLANKQTAQQSKQQE